MTEPRPTYATATAPYAIARDEAVTLTTTTRKAALLHHVEALRNKHRRGDVARYALIDLETLEVGSIIAFEV